MAALLAVRPAEIPGATVNRLCASGMEAVSDAARLAAGEPADAGALPADHVIPIDAALAIASQIAG